MNNIKDTLTTIAGILGFIAGAGATVLGILSQYPDVVVPVYVKIILGVCGALSIFIIGYFGGKNPNGSGKTPRQVDNLNNEQAATKGIK